MPSALRPIAIVLAILVALALALFIGHEMLEARIFRELTNQPGLEISIGSRRGSLLRGYDLTDLSIRQTTVAAAAPSSSFTTSSITLRWRLRPFRVTEIAWDAGTITLLSPDGSSEEIPLGAGSLRLDESGWLASDEDVSVGPDGWRGSATIRIRGDLREVDGSVRIDRLPGRILLMGGAVPDDFIVPGQVLLDMRLTGPPSSMRASGRVSDPVTRRSFRF